MADDLSPPTSNSSSPLLVRRRGDGQSANQAGSTAGLSTSGGVLGPDHDDKPLQSTPGAGAAVGGASTADVDGSLGDGVNEATVKKVHCWGCNQILAVPMADPVVQCACCGAYLDADNGAAEARKRNLDTIYRFIIKFPVLFATAIIGGCIGGGIFWCLPWYLQRASVGSVMATFHYTVASVISFNLVWNFAVCVLFPVGRKSRVPWQPLPPQQVFPTILNACKLCMRCQQPKLPSYHHCSTCGVCVPDLDHHCLYIGRCVGKTNHRQFLLFLLFVWFGVFYMTVMTVFGMMQVNWKLQQFAVRQPAIGVSGIMNPATAPSAVWNQLDGDMQMGLVLGIMFCIGVSVTIAVGILTFSQFEHVGKGETALDAMARASGRTGGSSASLSRRERLATIFGHGPVWLWWLPRLPASRPPLITHANVCAMTQADPKAS